MIRLNSRSSVISATLAFGAFMMISSGVAHSLPTGFVYLDQTIPHLAVDLKYLGADNFLGRPVDGYVKSRCILTREAANALGRVQAELNRFGLGLKIFDAYRPQRAVDDFVRWARDLDDLKMKKEFYPNVKKASLFSDGYIASRSAHSRGSAVDLTIVSLTDNKPGDELDMGSPFDFFDPKSWVNSPELQPQQRANRMLLRNIMEKHGFLPYEKEWWHFILKKEPYPKTYFDFPVE